MIMNKLFAKRDGGGFQEWTIEYEGDSYRSIAGMVGGKINTSEWTKCAGKNIGKANETTPEKQAELEAKAKWQKKYDEGYREDIEELSNVDTFWPMLAKKYSDYSDRVVFPIITQPKLNGIRIVMSDKGAWSRRGKKFMTLKHLEDSLMPIIKENPGLVIDGEGYSDDLNSDFEKICSLIKKTKPKKEDLEEAKNKIKMHVYDCCFMKEPNLSFKERFERIKIILKDVKEVQIVDTYEAKSPGHLDDLYKEFLTKGYEGQMIRFNTPYENKRTVALLKRKEFTDEEFKIEEIIEGKGNRQGMVGSMGFKNSSGIKFNANMKGSHDYLRELWKEKDNLIGKMATVKYFCLTKEDKVPYLPHVITIRNYE
jgi:ATP-dependent DNA ligase